MKKNTRNPSKPQPTGKHKPALTASPLSILSASLHSPNLPIHTPRAKAHSWKGEGTWVIVLPVQDNPTLIPASNQLTAHTKCSPTKTKAPTHPSCCSSTPWESWTIGTAHRSHCSHQELEGKTQVESTQQGLRGAGVPLHRHHAALTTKHQTAARSPQLLLEAMHLLQKAAPSPHNPNRGQGHSWQPSSLRQRAPGPGEKEQLRAALLQEALSSCRAGPPCLVLSPAVNATQRVANAAWGHEDNPHLAPALPLWREQLLKPPLRGCCCSGTHKPRP